MTKKNNDLQETKSSRQTVVAVCVLFGLLTSAIFFASLIIGALRINSCPSNILLPIWLVVFGAIGLCLLLFGTPAIITASKDSNREFAGVILLFVACFVLGGWSVTGVTMFGPSQPDSFQCDLVVCKLGLALSIICMVLVVFGCCGVVAYVANH